MNLNNQKELGILGNKLKKIGTQEYKIPNFTNRPFNTLENNYARFYNCMNLLGEYEHILLFFNRVLGRIKANPSDDNVIKVSKELYIHPKYFEENSKIANVTQNENRVFLNSLKNSIRNNRHENYFLVGERGVGKTYFINYFCNQYNADFIDNNIIWLRFDISKAYALGYDFLEFVDIHTLYVIFKYCRNLKPFEEVVNFNEKFQKYIKFVLRKKMAEISQIQIVIIEINKLYQEKALNNNYTQRLEKVLNEYPCLKNLGSIILSYFLENKYKLLYVIDGVDNIDYRREPEKYDKFLNDISRNLSIEIEKSAIDNATSIIVCRHETFHHLINNGIKAYGGNQDYEVLPITVQDLVVKKFSKLNDVMNFEFFKKEFRGIKKTLTKNGWGDYPTIVDDFVTFAGTFTEDIIESLKEFGIESDSDIINILYGKDIRSLTLGIINTYAYKRVFEEKTNLYNRKYILPEALFMDGGLFIDSLQKDDRRNSSIPNLLFYEAPSWTGPWYGLCGIRMLMVLENFSDISEELIIKLLSCFYDNEAIITGFLKKFIEQGLILTSLIKKADTFRKQVKYKISGKGKFYLTYCFKNIGFLYYCIIDSPIPILGKNIVMNGGESYENHIVIHDVKWTKYVSSVMETILTFMKIVNSQIKIDKQKFYKKSVEAKKLDADTEAFNFFSIDCKNILDYSPNFDEICIELEYMISSLERPIQNLLIKRIDQRYEYQQLELDYQTELVE